MKLTNEGDCQWDPSPPVRRGYQITVIGQQDIYGFDDGLTMSGTVTLAEAGSFLRMAADIQHVVEAIDGDWSHGWWNRPEVVNAWATLVMP